MTDDQRVVELETTDADVLTSLRSPFYLPTMIVVIGQCVNK